MATLKARVVTPGEEKRSVEEEAHKAVRVVQNLETEVEDLQQELGMVEEEKKLVEFYLLQNSTDSFNAGFDKRIETLSDDERGVSGFKK